MNRLTAFRPDLLPPARTFYEHELGELSRADRRGWAKPKAGCPFHASRSKKSFAVNLATGGFYCFGCQAKGGDVIAFAMRRDRLGFIETARRLGALVPANDAEARRFRKERAQMYRAEQARQDAWALHLERTATEIECDERILEKGHGDLAALAAQNIVLVGAEYILAKAGHER